MKTDNSFVTDGVTGVSFDTDAIAAELLASIEDFSTADSIQYSFPFTDTPPTYDDSHTLIPLPTPTEATQPLSRQVMHREPIISGYPHRTCE